MRPASSARSDRSTVSLPLTCLTNLSDEMVGMCFDPVNESLRPLKPITPRQEARNGFGRLNQRTHTGVHDVPVPRDDSARSGLFDPLDRR